MGYTLYKRLRAQDIPVSEWTEVEGGRGAVNMAIAVAHDNGMTIEFKLDPPVFQLKI